jgi:hypothetical protein
MIVYKLDGREMGVPFPAKSRDFSLLNSVKTGSVARSTSYPMDTRVERLEREASHSPPSSSEVKHMLSYTFTLHTFSWRGASLIKDGQG